MPHTFVYEHAHVLQSFTELAAHCLMHLCTQMEGGYNLQTVVFCTHRGLPCFVVGCPCSGSAIAVAAPAGMGGGAATVVNRMQAGLSICYVIDKVITPLV